MTPRYRVTQLKSLTFNLKKQLEALERLCFPLDDPYEFKAPGKEQTWVVYAGEHMVGFATAVLKDKHTLYLSRVGVHKEHRKQRLGRRLVAARKRYAKRIGCRRIITYTVTINTASNKNLISQGFQPFGAKKYGEKYVLLWWELKL